MYDGQRIITGEKEVTSSPFTVDSEEVGLPHLHKTVESKLFC